MQKGKLFGRNKAKQKRILEIIRPLDRTRREKPLIITYSLKIQGRAGPTDTTIKISNHKYIYIYIIDIYSHYGSKRTSLSVACLQFT
jgi:hypothetical protein